MVAATAKSSLSPEQSRLVEWMQTVNFGRVEQLLVRGGEPVFTPPPRVIRDIKLGADNGARPEIARADFELKREVRELFTHLEAIGDGVVHCLEVKHGLPFKMTVEEVPA
jgi:hypothetical protein